MNPTLLNYDHRHALFVDNEGMRWITALLTLCLLAPVPASAQSSAWRGFVLLEFAPEFGTVDQNKQALLREAFSGLAPTAGDYPPYLLQLKANLAGDKLLAEARWYAPPERSEFVRVLAYKFDASLLQAEAWLVNFSVFAEGESYEASVAQVRLYLRGNEVAWERRYR